MKNKIRVLFLVGTMAICLGGFEARADAVEAVNMQGEESMLSFQDLTGRQFCFASGAGAWATLLTIQEDGSFSGEYFDRDMGASGDAYPNGTMYQSNFSGTFTQPVRVNAYTYSMQIREISYDKEVGTEEIIDGVLYHYTEVYGLDGAEDILVYLPNAPIAELPQEFRSWVGYSDLPASSDTTLPFYALYNEKEQCGFSSYSFLDNLKETVAAAEESAAALENSIQNESLSQAQLNEKTGQLYELWDGVLNHIWSVLEQTKDEETMMAITEEELAWINQKEEAAAQAGAEFEGGSLQPMVMNQTAAEMTKARVYELLELF